MLDLLAKAEAPLSAYALADRASAAGQRTVPNQVYRTLARLIEAGRVHRLESLSAFMLKRDDVDASLICADCHAVLTLVAPDHVAQLAACAKRLGFVASKVILETHGRCADCAAVNSREVLENAPSDRPRSERDAGSGNGSLEDI